MSPKSLIVVLTVMLCRVPAKKILCQMVSLETDDTISGYCCVIFRNQTDIDAQEEEVKKKILESFKNATLAQVAPRAAGNDDVVNFPTEDYSQIRFPGATSGEDLKNMSSADQQRPVAAEVGKNGTVDIGEKRKSKTSGNETIITVIAVNRNAVDIPETCPDGNEKDLNGDCVPVF